MYVAAIAAVIVGLGFLAYLAHEVRKDLAKRRAVRANRLGWSQHARDVERGVRSPEGERK